MIFIYISYKNQDSSRSIKVIKVPYKCRTANATQHHNQVVSTQVASLRDQNRSLLTSRKNNSIVTKPPEWYRGSAPRFMKMNQVQHKCNRQLRINLEAGDTPSADQSSYMDRTYMFGAAQYSRARQKLRRMTSSALCSCCAATSQHTLADTTAFCLAYPHVLPDRNRDRL